MALTLVATLATTIAQSKFSGIYAGSSSNRNKVIMAITKGGHILGLDSDSEGLVDALNPSKSTVNVDGKLKSVTGDGQFTLTGTISSDFKFKGTGKEGSQTIRITASRTLD